MSTFSKGDKVRCIETWTTYVVDRGGVYTVEAVRPDDLTDTMKALVNGQWVPFSYFEKVEPEWVVGQQVRGDDFAYLPRGTVVGGPGVPTRRKDALGMWVTDDLGYEAAVPDKGMAMSRTITYLPEHAEPEDTDDAYVEPEPLKEGDWVQVWAKVHDPSPKDDELVELRVRIRGGGMAAMYTTSDTIVRPDAGQVPPWVKPARCTSLYDSGKGNNLMRCEGEAGHEAKHVVGWIAWTDAEAYGTVEVSS